MARDSYQSLKSEIARDLRQLADILLSTKFIKDVTPLYSAENRCRSSKGDSWSYELAPLVFHRLGNFQNIIPRRLLYEDIILELSLEIQGLCDAQEYEDPLSHLSLNIYLKGEFLDIDVNNHSIIKMAECAWHLDKDSGKEEDGAQEFIHPCYHFQFGGHHMNASIYDFGATMILGSPRLAHPPLDAVLGIDFVLTNFMSASSLEFRNDGQYQNIIRRSQERLWKPYLGSLAQSMGLSDLPNADWGSSVWPQLIA